MVTVKLQDDTKYIVTIDTAELNILSKIAKGYMIPTWTALASCINKGLDHYQSVLQEIADHETRKRKGD